MSSSAQLVGHGSGSAAAGGAAWPAAHGRTRNGDAAASPGAAARRTPAAPPERDASPSPANVVRLPGQEVAGGSGPRRPLISGGAFTLAVAIGLSHDQSSRPASLEPVTPSSAGGAAAGADEEGAEAAGIDGLTEEEQRLVEDLRARDAEVRRHEAAHAAAGGQYAGSPRFTYQTGPDGRQYAVGGAVSIDTAPIKGDPEATLRKAQQIKAAAAAPAEPSAQDRRVAAQADALRQQAQAEIAVERQDERQVEEAEAAAAEARRDEEQAAGEGTAGVGSADGAEAGDASAAAFSRGVFASGAFSAAAASYRGPAETARVLSLAV